MEQLVELNNTILGALKLKYMTLKLFKENNINERSFDISVFLEEEFRESVNFNHELLESYLTFKDILKGHTMPGMEKIGSDFVYYGDIVNDSDLPHKIPTELGFKVFNEIVDVEHSDESSIEKFKETHINLYCVDIDTLVDSSDNMYFTQTAICHPFLDQLLSHRDSNKAKILSDYLDYNDIYLANFFLPPLAASCDYATISIISVDKLKTTTNFKNKDFGDSKNAILIESIEIDYSQDEFYYQSSLCAFLDLYALLLKEKE